MPQPPAPAFRALTEYRASIGDYSRFAMRLEGGIDPEASRLVFSGLGPMFTDGSGPNGSSNLRGSGARGPGSRGKRRVREVQLCSLLVEDSSWPCS